MVCLPFTKKARARDAALAQLRHLLAIHKLPANFWNQPYAVAFILGYTGAVTRLVAGEHKSTDDYVSDVQTTVLFELAPQERDSVVRRLAGWRGAPQFSEGLRNGKFLAMFLQGDKSADEAELAKQAFKLARDRAPVFEQMPIRTNERGRAAMILAEVLLFEKIAAPTIEKPPVVEPKTKQKPPERPKPSTKPASDLYSKARAELGNDELGLQTLAALEAERSGGGINDVIEAEIFANLFIEDRKRLGAELAIKDIVEASLYAVIAFKLTSKKITEEEMDAELTAIRGKFTKQDVAEAEIFAKSIGELEAERGELIGKDIIEAKVFARFFARALAKVSVKQEADTSAKVESFRVGAINHDELPRHYGTIWLDGDETWVTHPTQEVSFDGRSYTIRGGVICFPKHKVGREALLKMLRTQRDLWAPGDEAALKRRLIERAEKLGS